GDGNGYICPDETADLYLALRNNDDSLNLTNVDVQLIHDGLALTVLNAFASYPDLPVDGLSQVNTTPFTVRMNSGVTPSSIPVTLRLTSDQVICDIPAFIFTGVGRTVWVDLFN